MLRYGVIDLSGSTPHNDPTMLLLVALSPLQHGLRVHPGVTIPCRNPHPHFPLHHLVQRCGPFREASITFLTPGQCSQIASLA